MKSLHTIYKPSMYKIELKKVLGLVALVCIIACSNREKKFRDDKSLPAATNAQSAPGLKVFDLRRGSLGATLVVPGELLPFQKVDLYAKETSYVKKVVVDVGSEVKTGQLLIRLEAPEIGSALAGAESRVKQQEAVLFASQASFNRLYETSKTPGTVSKNDLEQAMAKKNADSAQLLSLRSAYREVAEQRSYLEIHAPFSGVISEMNVYTGAYVGPSGRGSDRPLMVLEEQRKLRLVVSVPAYYAGQLHLKDQVQFTLKSMPGHPFNAMVQRMAGSLDSRLRSERVEMDVYNPKKQLLPGMPVEVQLKLKSGDSVFVVPASAAFTTTDGTFVIRVHDDRFDRVRVERGEDSNGKVTITGDLSPNDLLVLQATDEMRKGSPSGRIVKVALEKAAP